ncbi:winged helix-turn-helix transcriptional regulator [Salipiger mucosus]|uniref:DNA-binding protein response regulator n=1 Tax=Salipiger mucosus DSM 16094 TaxID=1123237 RepID=S9QZH5_9RHOB|nr:response regulator transcription factor [Salipiger mucosus]EPX86786.1 DNA-binding protein response regulator [Salipiger mucosus DSM 16094]
MRYLVAETNWALMGLSRALRDTGTLITTCEDAEDLEEFHRIGAHDLVLFDAALLEGGRSPAHLREMRPGTPVCLFARKADPVRIAAWYEAGADLVIAADTPHDEAVARLQAVARRAHGLAQPRVELGPLCVDLATRRVHMDGVTLSLSPKLYAILEYLALRPGRLASRERLLSHVYGFENEPAPRVFDVYMCNLRAHLSAVSHLVRIETVRGQGYRLALSPALTDPGSLAA